MSIKRIVAILAGIVLAISTLVMTNSASATTPDDLTGSIAADGCSIPEADRTVTITYQKHVSEILFLNSWAMDYLGVDRKITGTLLAGEPTAEPLSFSYPLTWVTDNGVGPWTLRLFFSDGSENGDFDLNEVVIESCGQPEPPVTEPTVTTVDGTCQVQVTPADSAVSFALAGGKPSTRAVNSTLVDSTSSMDTYVLDVVRDPKKSDLKSGFKVKVAVNEASFTVKVPSDC